MNELEIYDNFDIQNRINNNKGYQSGGGNNNVINNDFTSTIIENIEENNNIRKNIELSLCIYKQLSNFNTVNTKKIINELKK